MTASSEKAANKILSQLAPHQKPEIAIICGTGLSHLRECLSDIKTFSYNELPGFPELTVESHVGSLVIGAWKGRRVCLLMGRKHFYEGIDPEPIKTYVRTLKLIGCQQLIVTNAAGSLREDLPPGTPMIIKDHINLQGTNPLIGPNDKDFGTRFPSMKDCYDPDEISKLKAAAQKSGILVQTGVYVAVLGPSFETAAEIKAFHLLGGDAVGMSTASEVIIARHCGLKVSGICAISNFGTGLDTFDHDHYSVIKEAGLVGSKISDLLAAYLEESFL